MRLHHTYKGNGVTEHTATLCDAFGERIIYKDV